MIVLFTLGGCGSDDPQQSSSRPRKQRELLKPGESGTFHAKACGALSARVVARAVGTQPGQLDARPNDSLDLTICDWSGGPVRLVRLTVDSAPRAQLRYYNLLSEQLEYHNANPARKPRQIKGVGEDSAYGGAGAWWTRATSQLVAYDDERMIKVRVNVRGFDDAASRAAAVKIGRRAVRRLRGSAS